MSARREEIPSLELDRAPASGSTHQGLAERLAALEQDVERRELVHRIRGVVEAALPPSAVVAVVSRGDDDLLHLGGERQGWHLPQTPEGVYAGGHPADSEEAIRQLEAARAKGADFLLIPMTSYWWLDHYSGFERYLAERLRLVTRVEDTCMVYGFPAEDPVARAEAAVEAALEVAPSVDLSWLGPAAAGTWALAPDALRFLASLVAQIRPLHVVEFGSGLSTRVLARACRDSHPGCGLTSLDHDVDFMRIAEAEVGRDERCQVIFQAAPLVLRRCFGRLVPLYRLNRKRFVSQLPADLILVDGPPELLGGREGTLYQALEFSRPGTVVVLDDAGREAEAAALANWQKTLGEDIAVRSLPGYERGLAVVVIRSTRKRRGLSDVRVDHGKSN